MPRFWGVFFLFIWVYCFVLGFCRFCLFVLFVLGFVFILFLFHFVYWFVFVVLKTIFIFVLGGFCLGFFVWGVLCGIFWGVLFLFFFEKQNKEIWKSPS